MSRIDQPVFGRDQARYMLALAGLDADDMSDENLARIGLVSTKTQRQQVLDAYEITSSVDGIFDILGGTVPKSSIRAYLSQSVPNGDWRQRRRRRNAK